MNHTGLRLHVATERLAQRVESGRADGDAPETVWVTTRPSAYPARTGHALVAAYQITDRRRSLPTSAVTPCRPSLL